MASIPPRTSYTMSPHLRTPDNRPNSLSLVPVTTKDASPATGAFSSGRSPLSSIGNNALEKFGLRQRRQHQTFEGSSPFFNVTETMKGPPRASLTMSMGGHGGGGVMTPKFDSIQNGLTGGQIVTTTVQRGEYWILVFGFTSKDTREEVLRRFKAMGNVTHVKMASGSKNWVALCYDSELTAEMAASEKDFQISDGSFCGVRRLANHQEFFLDQQRLYSSVLSQNVHGESLDGQVGLFSPPNKDITKEEVAEIEEADILIASNHGKGQTRNKTCCESIMGWIYGW